MNMENYKIKLTRNNNKNERDHVLPDYSIVYKAKGSEHTRAGYDILSRLKADNDLVMELSSSMILGTGLDTEKLTVDFLSNVRNMNLDYSCRQTSVPAKQSFLSQLFTGVNKATVSNEILAYISDTIWKEKSFQDMMPLYGARYYVTNNAENGKELLERMSRMTEPEKREYFKLIAFHASILGQFGIVSKYITESELKMMLEL